MADNRPVDRLQAFLAAIAGDESAPELEPRDQMEYYLAKMAERIGNIQPGPGGALYPIPDGTYTQIRNGVTNITVTGNHMTVDHVSSSGNGITNLICVFPGDVLKGPHTVNLIVSNFTGATNANCILKLGTPDNAASVDIYKQPFGDGEHTVNTNYQLTDSGFWFTIPWSGAYHFEFDFEFYVDGVRWC